MSSQFVSSARTCENVNLHVPTFVVPEHMLDTDNEDKVGQLLSSLIKIVGAFAEIDSGIRTKEFKELAKEFKKLTGVDLMDVRNEMRSRIDS